MTQNNDGEMVQEENEEEHEKDNNQSDSNQSIVQDEYQTPQNPGED